ncbi:Rab GDP dissociation inhibitor alpha isoform 3 [Schistosoma japonicum]|uniref:Rab GDP dissociation inhibitor n=2 Tax=Schistosoma japonicum TaxID=6182 RepID=Q5DA59_SCHJA|nr:SJCHGC01783 protein [Schistosoma japonicum]KAH8860741.1 Rab GDP dissociation inhibitor alpha [Schistosoma japonicum]TNN17963.1 Rab GDP dissociation inhibitor alpha isoform 3 [Schistosoma japonicum]
MDDEYDIVVLGTGLKECILSGLMSVEGKKVLHMDRNDYYGAETTSITPLEALFQKFQVNADLKAFGRGRDWNIDLIPKFLMADGKLVKLLVHTGVTRYLEFKSIEESYVYHNKAVHKVPSTAAEALRTTLVSHFSKKKLKDFLQWVADVDPENPSTWTGVYPPPKSIMKDSIELAFKHYGVESAMDFVGHAICLYTDDSYKQKAPAIEVITKMQLYNRSLNRFGSSPYLYPLYGLGELSQSFARLSAVYGGTYMLNKPIDKIVVENGKVVGVMSEGKVARCGKVICDPSYAPDRVQKCGQVVRAICILNHAIPNVKNSHSLQIIIPHNQVNRCNDIYISCVSHLHHVCPEKFYLVLVATTVETSNPHQELQSGLQLLGHIEHIFYSIADLFEPVDDGKSTNIFVSKSYDASTHFESTCTDVLNIYERITGHPFDFSKVTRNLENE